MGKKPSAYRQIGEVSHWLGVPASTLRYWGTRFKQIRPIQRAGGRRYYRPEDLVLLGGIKVLLYEQGFSIDDLRREMRANGVGPVARWSPPLPDGIETPKEFDKDRIVTFERPPEPEIPPHMPEEDMSEEERLLTSIVGGAPGGLSLQAPAMSAGASGADGAMGPQTGAADGDGLDPERADAMDSPAAPPADEPAGAEAPPTLDVEEMPAEPGPDVEATDTQLEDTREPVMTEADQPPAIQETVEPAEAPEGERLADGGGDVPEETLAEPDTARRDEPETVTAGGQAPAEDAGQDMRAPAPEEEARAPAPAPAATNGAAPAYANGSGELPAADGSDIPGALGPRRLSRSKLRARRGEVARVMARLEALRERMEG